MSAKRFISVARRKKSKNQTSELNTTFLSGFIDNDKSSLTQAGQMVLDKFSPRLVEEIKQDKKKYEMVQEILSKRTKASDQQSNLVIGGQL